MIFTELNYDLTGRLCCVTRSADAPSWRRSLAPIIDQFVRAAAGDVDTGFWRRIYNPADAYGGEVITGWAARLYPYLKCDGAIDSPNPLLELTIDEPRELTSGRMGYAGPGIRSDQVPATLARVIINVNDRVGRDNRAMALHGGLLAVTEDHDGTLQPITGWHLSPAQPQIDDVIDRIVRDHHTTAPQDGRLFFASADLAALYRRIGSATLFDGAWRLRPVAEHGHLYRGEDHRSIVTVIDLPDGRCLGAAIDQPTQTLHWLACRVARKPADRRLILCDPPSQVTVYGTSLTMLLAAALETGGDISHLETERLEQIDQHDRTHPTRTLRPHASAPDAGRQPPSPDLDIDQQIAQIRQAKKAAIDRQDFEQAAFLRNREKELLATAVKNQPPAP